jgi:hypothetical protein
VIEELSQLQPVVFSVTYRAVKGCTNTSPVGPAKLRVAHQAPRGGRVDASRLRGIPFVLEDQVYTPVIRAKSFE